ncbi:unnamed protein product [Gadus morhua 'NCC']
MDIERNVETVQERARKLADVDERAEALKESTSIRLKRSYDEKNSCCNQKKRKLVLVIVVAGALVIILIIVLLATGVIPMGSSSSSSLPPFPIPTAYQP